MSKWKISGLIALGVVFIGIATFVITTHTHKPAKAQNNSSTTTPAVSSSANTQLTQGTEIPSGISCPSSNFCVVADDSGNVYTFNGTAWTQPNSLASTLTDVSCASYNYCVAIGVKNAYVYKGGSWSSSVNAPDQGALAAVSCPSTTFCMTVDENGAATTFNGSSWGKLDQIEQGSSTGFTSVSCSSDKFCVATDNNGGVATYNNGTWSSVVQVANGEDYNTPESFAQPESVSCTRSKHCVAVDKFGNAYTFDGASWSKAKQIDKYSIAAVSCPSVGWCTAVIPHGTENTSFTGYASTLQNGSWSSPKQIDNGAGVDVVSCASTSFCMGVDADMFTVDLNQ
jgi:hypothetical protein